MHDVHPRQVAHAIHAEGRFGGVLAHRTAVENDAVVGVGIAQETQLVGFEGLHAQSVGLVHLAGTVDLVVEDGEHPHASGLGGGGDANRVQQVQVGVGAYGGWWTHGAGDDHRTLGLDGQMEKVGGLLQRGRAVGDDYAGRVGFFALDGVDALRQGNPVSRTDGGAAHADHVLGDDVEVLVDFRHPLQVLVNGEVVAYLGVQGVVHPVGADAGDAAAGGDDVYGGLGHGRLLMGDDVTYRLR